MHIVYLVVLIACTAGAAALAGWRLAHLWRRPHPGWPRVLNEWAWTLIPLLTLVGLLWEALKVSK